MTALIYLLHKDFVYLAMDSLSLDLDKRPAIYVTKFFLLPHLQCIICGTGIYELVVIWVGFVRKSMIFTDIVALNTHVQDHLKKISDKLNIPKNQSSTVYHFGVDKRNKKIVGFAYRSKNSYESEKLIYGLGIKPNYRNVVQEALNIMELNVMEKNDINKGFVSIITRLKETDDNLELEQRQGIGGEIYLVILDKNGKYSVETIHQFPDYEQVFSKILERNDVTRC